MASPPDRATSRGVRMRPAFPPWLRLVFHACTSRGSRLAGAGVGCPDRHHGDDVLRRRHWPGGPPAGPVRMACRSIGHGRGRVVDAGRSPVGPAQRPHRPQARADAGDECLHRGLHRAGGVHRCRAADNTAGAGLGAGAGRCTWPDRPVLRGCAADRCCADRRQGTHRPTCEIPRPPWQRQRAGDGVGSGCCRMACLQEPAAGAVRGCAVAAARAGPAGLAPAGHAAGGSRTQPQPRTAVAPRPAAAPAADGRVRGDGVGDHRPGHGRLLRH